MSEPEESYERFSDPARVFEDGRAEKFERQSALNEALAGPREPEADDEAVLDQFVDRVAERIIKRLQAEPEPELQAAGAGAGAGFDGGARASVPGPPESHDSLLIRLLRSRAADRGADF
jgi:hypothetical protein